MRRPSGTNLVKGPRHPPRAFFFFLLVAAALTASCEDPIVLGVRAHELRDRLLAGDRSLILSAPTERLAELARLGPGALYYAARAAGLSGDGEREIVLLELASRRESGLFRRRAWELLPEALYRRQDWAGLLAFSERGIRAGIDDYISRRQRVEALTALGLLSEAREELGALSAAWPEEAGKDEALLSGLRFRTAADPSERSARIRELFALQAPRIEDLEEALAAAEALTIPEPWSAERSGAAEASVPAEAEAVAAGAPFPEGELGLFRMRFQVARRDYGAAYRALASFPGLLSPALPRAYLSDAGKAYLYAPAPEEGIRAMSALEAAARAALTERREGDAKSGTEGDSESAGTHSARVSAADPREALYVAVFYRARMLSRLERRAEAAEEFVRAWELAPSGEDRDAAAWYRAESLLPTSRREAAVWLARTAPSWHAPASFADVLERLAREALLAKDGAVLYILRSEAAPWMSPRAASRLVYVAGRAAETGIAPPRREDGTALDPGDYARRAYEEVRSRSPEPYYRLLAAHRLGQPLVRIPPSRPIETRHPESRSARDARRYGPETEDYLAGFALYGLADLVPQEARALEGSPEAPDFETRRRLAVLLRDSGNPAASMLVMNRLFEDPGYEPSREDWELLWPRPWPVEVSAAAAASGMEEHVLYGLARSESYFRPAVVSRAGAVGLAQLMPATAEETARRLRLGSYNLEDPADNLRLGSAHFAGLLRALNGRVLPSVFAYNAGLSRVRQWERAAPGFPDDLLLESLSIEETRQYGRNVLWASVVYGVLHYGLDAEEALARMLGERGGTSSRP